MLFVILSDGEIPGYGVRGPVITPSSYDLRTVLKWIASGVDVREYMGDGSYRKLKFNDGEIMKALDSGYVQPAVKEPIVVYTKQEVVKPVKVNKAQEPQKKEKTYPNMDKFIVDELEDINE